MNYLKKLVIIFQKYHVRRISKGIITYDDESVTALIQFVLDEKTVPFELNAFEMDGVPQNQYMQVQLLDAMFEE